MNGFKKEVVCAGILFFVLFHAFPQNDNGKALLNQKFRFRDGIFLNFDQVKSNQPILKSRILTIVGYNDQDFYNKVLSHEVITYFDDNGIRRQVKKDNIWGYARNGILYVQIKGHFDRITIVGGICHFVGTITTYETRYYDPNYQYYYPYYFYYPSYYETSTYERTEMRQFILDFETGKIMEYNVESVEVALMRDPELYDEYVKLGPRKKKQLKFLYIRKFNERNPVYLPASK
ncbi:MAG TPA: hypothetical protein ENK25_09170 [Bacteroidetes bacterium]|nr:hypothetical protein [Bacteroidota bacterium]